MEPAIVKAKVAALLPTVYSRHMSTAIYAILDDLRHLPSADVKAAAEYIHHLRENHQERANQAIRDTAGALAGPDGDGFEESIKEFDHIDQEDHGTW